MPPMSPYLSRLPKMRAATVSLRGDPAIGDRAEARSAGFDGGVSPLKDVLAAYALRSFELELPKHDAADLAGERLGQVGDELDAPRVGIG